MDDGRLEEIARRHGIVLMLKFGSAASGRTHPRSDVDIAILRERPDLPFRERAVLAHELQALVPEGDVDLALINRADPLFLKKPSRPLGGCIR